MTLHGNTDYSLAGSPKDYREANEFLKKEEVDYTGLSFPTIIARREKDVIGVISTIKGEPRITAGPLHINVGKGDQELFTTIKLTSCYDGILKKAGITKYWIWMRVGAKLIEVCEQLPCYKRVEMNDNEDYVWFERSL
jgi:hypothetical protein